MVDLPEMIDPDRPHESGFAVGQQVGDEFAQITMRFIDTRLQPLHAHMAETYGPKVAADLLSTFAQQLRRLADLVEPGVGPNV